MTSFRITLSPSKRAAGRFIARVRRELQKALAEEKAARGLTQSDIARTIEVHRSVIHRELLGVQDLTVGRIAELADAMGRVPIFSLPRKAVDATANIPAGEISVSVETTGTYTLSPSFKSVSEAA